MLLSLKRYFFPYVPLNLLCTEAVNKDSSLNERAAM
jgi:hypothetical protein